MNHPFRTVIAAALVLTAGCAMAAGGDQALVSPSQPHAVISTALPPGPSYYRARIVWLDGNYLSDQRRNSFWVRPGKHTIGFRAILNANRGPILMSTPATSASQNLPKLTIDLKRGYTYYFVAKVPRSGNPAQWRPILIKAEKTH